MLFPIRLMVFSIAALVALQARAVQRIDEHDRRLHSRPGEVANRDKTGTSGQPENNNGSQAIAIQQLASPVSFAAEDKGFEPSTGFPAPDFESVDNGTALSRLTLVLPITSKDYRDLEETVGDARVTGEVAAAGHNCPSERRSVDPDLARVISAWGVLSPELKRSIVAIVNVAQST